MRSTSEIIKQTAFQMGKELITGQQHPQIKKPRTDEERGQENQHKAD